MAVSTSASDRERCHSADVRSIGRGPFATIGSPPVPSSAWHLAHATHLTRARRWRAGAITAAVVVALGGLFALTADEGFTDVPTYSGVVRTLTPSLVPTIGIDELREAHADLRRVVDSLPNAR